MEVWEAVRSVIVSKGLNNVQISKRLNKSKNYINAQLSSKRSPSVKTLATISHAVGWHVELVSDDGKERITIE